MKYAKLRHKRLTKREQLKMYFKTLTLLFNKLGEKKPKQRVSNLPNLKKVIQSKK